MYNFYVSISGASFRVSKSETTIRNDIKSGKLKTEPDENDKYIVSIYELFRVYEFAMLNLDELENFSVSKVEEYKKQINDLQESLSIREQQFNDIEASLTNKTGEQKLMNHYIQNVFMDALSRGVKISIGEHSKDGPL